MIGAEVVVHRFERPESNPYFAEIVASVDEASRRRGVLPYLCDKRKPVSAEDRERLDALGFVRRNMRSEGLHALAEWVHRYGFDVVGTVTFSDEVASSRWVYSLRRALDVAVGAVGDMGYRGPLVACGEWHPSGRSVPHVHLLVRSGSSAAGGGAEGLSRDLYAALGVSCGRCRFEPIRDTNAATLYAIKDAVKSCAADPDGLYVRLHAKKKRG